MPKNLKKIIGYVVALLLLVYIFMTAHFDWSKLALLSFYDIALISLTSILLLVVNGWGVWLQLKIFGFRIPWVQAFHVSQFYNLLNYLPLKAGLISEGLWLKKYYAFPYKKFVMSTAFVYVSNFFLYAVVILVIFANFKNLSALFSIVKLSYVWIFLLVLIILAAIYLFTPKSVAAKNTLSLLFMDRAEIIQAKWCVGLQFLILLGGLFLNAWRFMILFNVLGYTLSLPAALLLSILSGFSFLFAFTPGGLGIREGILGVLSYILFQNVAAGAIVSMIIRIIEFIWISGFGLYAYNYLERVEPFEQTASDQTANAKEEIS